MKYLLGSFFILLPFYIWADEVTCPVIGTKVEFRQAVEVYEYLSSQEVEPKDEFETTAQFEKRRNEAYKKLAGSSVMVIKDNLNWRDKKRYKKFEYDADNQRFILTRGFTDSNQRYVIGENGIICGITDNCLCASNDYTTNEIECIVDRESTELGTYTAKNAYGASVTVEKSKTVLHEILMRPGESSELSYSRTPFYINVPIEKAKKLKNKLQMGYVVKLEEPFSLNDVFGISPTRDNPREILGIYNKIVVELLCVIVTDDNNYVLKAFEAFL